MNVFALRRRSGSSGANGNIVQCTVLSFQSESAVVRNPSEFSAHSAPSTARKWARGSATYQCNIYINAVQCISALQQCSEQSQGPLWLGWGASHTQGTLLSQIITAADRASSEREHNKQQRGRWIYQNDCWCSPLKTYCHPPTEGRQF